MIEVTRSGVAATILVFVVVAVCIRLGFWQLDRRAVRLERNAAVAARLAEEPVVLRVPPADTAGLVNRRAEATGRYDHARSIVLAGRSRAGMPGVHLFTPLRPGDPAAGDAAAGAILVNRGWLPARDAANADLDAVRVDTVVRVEGVLLAYPDVRFDGDPAVFRTVWYRLAGDALRAQFPYPVAPVYLQTATGPWAGVAAPGAGAPYGPRASVPTRELPVPLDAPSLDAGPHLSYAVQWFSFATIFLIGWLLLVLHGPRRARGGERAQSGDFVQP